MKERKLEGNERKTRLVLGGLRGGNWDVLHFLFPSFNILILFKITLSPLPLSSVCGSAELPAAAGHAVVRRLPGLEEAALGCQTGHLRHHRPAVSRLLAGTDVRGGEGSLVGRKLGERGEE